MQNSSDADIIHIVCAGDTNYIIPSSVMLCSLFENNREHTIIVHYLGTNLSENDKLNLEELAQKYNRRINFYDVTPENYPPQVRRLLESGQIPSHITISTFNRLFITNYLPANIEKCIYIDGDTIITSSLLTLWHERLDNKSIGWCIDGQYLNCSARRMKLRNYCNAGVLLINIKKWRSINAVALFTEYIAKNINLLPYADQDVLNYIFRDDQVILHPRYNVMIYYYMNEPHYSTFIPCEYKTLGREAIYKPVIIHYVSGIKPWHKDCIHPMLAEWRKYFKMTKWNTTQLHYKYGAMKRIYLKIRNISKMILRLIPAVKRKYPPLHYLNPSSSTK